MTPVYIDPAQVCEMVPGLTEGMLSQMRYKSSPLRYYKVGKKVLYKVTDVTEYIESTARYGTAMEAI